MSTISKSGVTDTETIDILYFLLKIARVSAGLSSTLRDYPFWMGMPLPGPIALNNIPILSHDPTLAEMMKGKQIPLESAKPIEKVCAVDSIPKT